MANDLGSLKISVNLLLCYVYKVHKFVKRDTAFVRTACKHCFKHIGFNINLTYTLQIVYLV